MPIDYSIYYREYYNLKKHLYKVRYLEKKAQKIDEDVMFEPYGGMQKYYKDKMLEFCAMK